MVVIGQIVVGWQVGVVNGCRDLGVDRRDNLRPVAPVDLVAAVGRRVVASRGHHAGIGAGLPHRMGQYRRG